MAHAVSGSLPIQRYAPGLVVPVATVGLSSPIAGIVSAVLAKNGADVRANDVIARLDDRSIKASIDRDTSLLQRDQATLDDANLRLVRVKTLLPSGADSRQAEDDAAIAVKIAEASVAVSRANLQADQIALAQIEIRAPFDGRLGVVSVSPGGYLARGHCDRDTDQDEAALCGVHAGRDPSRPRAPGHGFRQADIRCSAHSDERWRRKVVGPIVFIDNAVDPASGTFKLSALVANDDGALWPGQAMDVEVVAGEQAGLVLVPGVAVQPQDDGGLCYVVTPSGRVRIAQGEGRAEGRRHGRYFRGADAGRDCRR